MTAEWIRFWIVAVLVALGLLALGVALLGTFRLKFSLNRIHSAAIADTLALALLIVGLAVAGGSLPVALKLAFVLGFQWCTSPITSHLLTKFEYLTDETLGQHCALPEQEGRDDA